MECLPFHLVAVTTTAGRRGPGIAARVRLATWFPSALSFRGRRPLATRAQGTQKERAAGNRYARPRNEDVRNRSGSTRSSVTTWQVPRQSGVLVSSTTCQRVRKAYCKVRNAGQRRHRGKHTLCQGHLSREFRSRADGWREKKCVPPGCMAQPRRWPVCASRVAPGSPGGLRPAAAAGPTAQTRLAAWPTSRDARGRSSSSSSFFLAWPVPRGFFGRPNVLACNSRKGCDVGARRIRRSFAQTSVLRRPENHRYVPVAHITRLAGARSQPLGLAQRLRVGIG